MGAVRVPLEALKLLVGAVKVLAGTMRVLGLIKRCTHSPPLTPRHMISTHGKDATHLPLAGQRPTSCLLRLVDFGILVLLVVAGQHGIVRNVDVNNLCVHQKGGSS